MADPITSRSRRGVSAPAAAAEAPRPRTAALALPRRAGRRRGQYAFVRADAARRLARTRDLRVLLRVAHAQHRLEKRRADGRRVRLRQLRDRRVVAVRQHARLRRHGRAARRRGRRAVLAVSGGVSGAGGRGLVVLRGPCAQRRGLGRPTRRSRRPGTARWPLRARGRSANGCAARYSPAFRGSRAVMRRSTARSPGLRPWRACTASAGCWRWWPH